MAVVHEKMIIRRAYVDMPFLDFLFVIHFDHGQWRVCCQHRCESFRIVGAAVLNDSYWNLKVFW